MSRRSDHPGLHPIHTGSFPCTFCDRTFASQQSAQRHENSVHRKAMSKTKQQLHADAHKKEGRNRPFREALEGLANSMRSK